MNKLLTFSFFILVCCTSSKKEEPVESPTDYFISTEKESNDRIKSLNLDKPSEDRSSILDIEKLSYPKTARGIERDEYKPTPKLEWIIDLSNSDKSPLKKDDLEKLLDYDWRSKFSSTPYGLSSESHKWTFALGDSPEAYNQIQIAVNLLETFYGDQGTFDSEKLRRYLTELEKRKSKFQKLKITAGESIESAISRSKQLLSIHAEFDKDVMIILQSNKQFEGMKVWDALQSVGLKWGDGDLFHWENKYEYGSDQHFSVWTASGQGYFLPEEIKDGNMNPSNLIFGFSIPRSADPVHIYEIMVNAAQYCQKRLGGVLLNENDKPLNVAQEKIKLQLMLDKMNAAGVKPGADETLMMFRGY